MRIIKYFFYNLKIYINIYNIYKIYFLKIYKKYNNKK